MKTPDLCPVSIHSAKCLVELSMEGGDEGGLSDVSLQVTALKMEFASYVSTSNVPKQQEVLKCPLCSEEQPIPKR